VVLARKLLAAMLRRVEVPMMIFASPYEDPIRAVHVVVASTGGATRAAIRHATKAATSGTDFISRHPATTATRKRVAGPTIVAVEPAGQGFTNARTALVSSIGGECHQEASPMVARIRRMPRPEDAPSPS
jgi:hypothetical protein